MSKLPEPDDVDFFVGGIEVGPEASRETQKAIEEYRKRPEYRSELDEAKRILAALGINAPDHGMPDAKALLDHWHRCVADLQRAESGGSHGTSVDQENTGVSPVAPSENQK
jgi:hypothetical protein